MHRAPEHTVGTHVPPAWDVWGNPIFRKCVRERLRWKPALIWCGVTALIAGLGFAEIFLTLTERGLAGAETAARNTFRGIFVIQALVLMLLGTGSVAAGMAREREQGVLDYHRMSPMSPTAKILGYLFGLPVREYLMAATTLPFTLASVWLGKLPVGNVAQLYLVFFTSVWLYHMTGLVAGMVARRPRRANWFTRLIIIALYLFLPRLASLGFTFLGYLTVMPAFDGLLAQQLGWQATETAGLWHQVGFFTVHVPPTLYTLLVQGLLLAALYAIVRRKWQQQTHHPFSKTTALIFYGVLQGLVLGSLWPFLSDGRLFRLALREVVPVEVQWLLTLYIFFFVAGVACMLLSATTTPTWDTYRRGLRRMRKRSQKRLSWRSDASPGLIASLGFAGITTVSYLLLFGLALPTEGLRWNPSPGAHLALLALFFGLVLQVQTVSAIWGTKGLAVLVGLVWILPVSIGIVLVSAWGAYVPAGYLAASTPAAGFGYGLIHLFEPALANEPEAQAILADLSGMLGVSLVLGLGLPAAGQAWLWRQRDRARADILK